MGTLSIIRKIKADPTGYFFSIIHEVSWFLKVPLFTFLVKIQIFLKGIKSGRSNLFFGYTLFRRFYLSSIEIGSRCRFRSSFASNLVGLNHKCSVATFSKEANIVIGDDCGFSGTVIGAYSSIRIGNNVICGGNTFITDFDWHLRRTEEFKGQYTKEVIIEDNVWLGLNVVVLKGVIIGSGSIIGANSVVTKSIPKNSIAAGNPCKVIKHFKND